MQPMRPWVGPETLCNSRRMQAVRRRRTDHCFVHPGSTCEHEFHQAALLPQRTSRRGPGGRTQLWNRQYHSISIRTSRASTGYQHSNRQQSGPRHQTAKCTPRPGRRQQQQCLRPACARAAGRAGTCAVQGLPWRPAEAVCDLPASKCVRVHCTVAVWDGIGQRMGLGTARVHALLAGRVVQQQPQAACCAKPKEGLPS